MTLIVETFSLERPKDCDIGLVEKELYSWLTTWLGFERYLHSHDNVNHDWFSGFIVNMKTKQGRAGCGCKTECKC